MLKVLSAEQELPEISKADYDSRKPGFAFANEKGGICYINAVGDAQAGFSVHASYTGSFPVVGVRGCDEPVQLPAITANNCQVTISVPFRGKHAIEFMDVQGKCIAKYCGNGPSEHAIPLATQAHSMYLVRITTNEQTVVKSIIH